MAAIVTRVHAAPPAVSVRLDKAGDQLVIEERPPRDGLMIPLKPIPATNQALQKSVRKLQ
jgi:hypothetical protein